MSLGSNKVKCERECCLHSFGQGCPLSQVGCVFVAIATLGSKWVLLSDLRENQVSWVDLPESTHSEVLYLP